MSADETALLISTSGVQPSPPLSDGLYALQAISQLPSLMSSKVFSLYCSVRDNEPLDSNEWTRWQHVIYIVQQLYAPLGACVTTEALQSKGGWHIAQGYLFVLLGAGWNYSDVMAAGFCAPALSRDSREKHRSSQKIINVLNAAVFYCMLMACTTPAVVAASYKACSLGFRENFLASQSNLASDALFMASDIGFANGLLVSGCFNVYIAYLNYPDRYLSESAMQSEFIKQLIDATGNFLGMLAAYFGAASNVNKSDDHTCLKLSVALFWMSALIKLLQLGVMYKESLKHMGEKLGENLNAWYCCPDKDTDGLDDNSVPTPTHPSLQV